MADDPSADDSNDLPDDSPDDSAAPTPSLSQRMSRALLGPTTPAEADGPVTDAEVKRRVSMIDPTERKIGSFGALFAALLSVVLTFQGIRNPKAAVPGPAKPTSHKTC